MRPCPRCLIPIVLPAVALWGSGAVWAAPAPWVSAHARPGDFPLVSAGQPADVVYAAEDFKVVAIAARDFAADVERVTGRRPAVRTAGRGRGRRWCWPARWAGVRSLMAW